MLSLTPLLLPLTLLLPFSFPFLPPFWQLGEKRVVPNLYPLSYVFSNPKYVPLAVNATPAGGERKTFRLEAELVVQCRRKE